MSELILTSEVVAIGIDPPLLQASVCNRSLRIRKPSHAHSSIPCFKRTAVVNKFTTTRKMCARAFTCTLNARARETKVGWVICFACDGKQCQNEVLLFTSGPRKQF